MKRGRFAIFGLILAVGVAIAVATLLAPPTRAQEPEQRPEREKRRPRVMMLDGRGAQLGVVVEDLSSEDLKSAGGATSGVRIEDVDRESPAEKAGLQEGDIVVEYDGERIRSARQFTRLVQETASGRTVKLGFVRNGQRQTVDVTPENRSMGWGFDSDLFGRDAERYFREIEPRLRELEPKFRDELRKIEPRLREIEPRLREFGPGFNFDFDLMPPLGARRRLGVQLERLTPQLADYFGAKDGGVLVSSVTPDSAAAKAGLKAGDVIISINGDRVRDYNELMSELRDASGEVTIGIVRDKKESTVKATIEESRPRVRQLRPAL